MEGEEAGSHSGMANEESETIAVSNKGKIPGAGYFRQAGAMYRCSVQVAG